MDFSFKMMNFTLKVMKFQVLWEADWINCPNIWVGPNARDLINTYHMLGLYLKIMNSAFKMINISLY